MIPRPNQERGVEAVLAAIGRGQRRLVLTSPTGGGKTLIMQMLARRFIERGEGVVVYTNRKLLVEQLSDALVEAKIVHGVRADGWEADDDALFQIASIQTEHSRSMKRHRTELHRAGLILVDEGHLHCNPTAAAIYNQHWADGAAYVLVTATPIGMEDYADELIVAGTNSELRECGALVLAHHYGPDEPDMRAWKKLRLADGKDLTEQQARKVMMTPGLFGRIWKSFNKLNPDRRPTLCFGPDVEGSIWIAKEFEKKGVTAAHIDGEQIYIDGHFEPSTRKLKGEILDGSRDGDICLLSNRFVLREGIDAPWLAHGIFATIFGSLQSYLQSGGRLLRSHPSLRSVTIQDHGGNWWRHGSLNSDRLWRLEDTSSSVYGIRAAELRENPLRQPACCPQCSRILGGRKCPCGWEASRKERLVRPVVGTDGELKELTGNVFAPRRVCGRPDGPKIWERMYYRSMTEKGRRSFAAAMALFAQENNWGWPDRNWPLMPINNYDLYEMVEDVPRERLR